MKIKKNMEIHIANLNAQLKKFSSENPDIIFKEVVNTDSEYYAEGSLSFENFRVFFRFSDSTLGYSFMGESPFESNEDLAIGEKAACYQMLFKFAFSPIKFSAYDIHNAINDRNFRPLSFDDIVDENSAANAVNAMLDFVLSNRTAISQIATDEILQDLLYSNYILDEKVFDNKFNEAEFNNEINDRVDLHELLMTFHIPIQDGLKRFILTGNSKLLIKEFNKAKKKNNLIIFEKRYEQYLYENNFPAPDTKTSNKEKTKKSKRRLTGIVNIISLCLSFVLGMIIAETVTVSAVEATHPESLFLGVAVSELAMIFLFLMPSVLLIILSYRLPFIKDRVNRMIKPKYDIPVVIAALILFVGGLFITADVYINHGIYIENDALYYNNVQVDKQNIDIEFIFIEGAVTYDDNNDEIYSNSVEYRELLYIIDGDYEEFTYCNFNNESGLVTDDVLNTFKEADIPLTSYKTIEAYADAHGFEITE